MSVIPDIAASKAAVRAALTAALAPVQIAQVGVAVDRDQDDEEILRVEVVFATDNPAVDGQKLLSASVLAQAALDAINDNRLAVIDFLNLSEADQAAE